MQTRSLTHDKGTFHFHGSPCQSEEDITKYGSTITECIKATRNDGPDGSRGCRGGRGGGLCLTDSVFKMTG